MCPKGHTKQTHRQLKTFRDYFLTKHVYNLYLKKESKYTSIQPLQKRIHGSHGKWSRIRLNLRTLGTLVYTLGK